VICIVAGLLIEAVAAVVRSRYGRIGIGMGLTGALAIILGGVLMTLDDPLLPMPFVGKHYLTSEQDEDVLEGLLINIHRALNYSDKTVAHDRLAASVSEDLIRDVYSQCREMLDVPGQGGARIKVDDITGFRVQRRVPGDSGLIYFCKWIAEGSVEHWGHTHRRANSYGAWMTIRPIDGQWKISAFDRDGYSRVNPKRRQRANEPAE
jgi:hypothetical protein